MIKKFIYFFVYSLIKLLFNLFKVRLCIISINRIGWQGESYFNGLRSVGNGRWDARAISLNLNYNFGNQNIKSRLIGFRPVAVFHPLLFHILIQIDNELIVYSESV